MNHLSDTDPSYSGWIGIGRVDITPSPGIYSRSWGASTHDAAEGVHRPLEATVATFQAAPGSDPLVLGSLDLGWWRTPDDEWQVRSALLETDALLPGKALDPARVMLSFTHTHAGPAICSEERDRPGGDKIEPYLAALRNAVVSAARQAMAEADPSVLTWRSGRCRLARHRDLMDPDRNRLVCGFNPGGHAEDTLLVGRITGADSRPKGVLINYACHPVTLAWENRLISPDYPGEMRRVVEQVTGGARCLFLQGASGELAPREVYTADTTIADRHGRELAYSVLSVLEGMLPPAMGLVFDRVVESGAPLAVWRREPFDPSRAIDARLIEIDLKLKELPSLSEIGARIRDCTDRVTGERLVRQRRVRMTVGDGSASGVPNWTWRLGDSLWLGHPNEAYSGLQTALRERFPDRAVVVMNVVNGHAGYLPPADLYDQDVYQVWQTPFERGCLERTIRMTGTALDSLLKENA